MIGPELVESLVRHPLRTLLTALSVAWGVFVLVALLGAGNGLTNNVEWEFRDDAVNSLWLYRGETSRPFAGTRVGTPVRFTDDDFELLRDRVPEVEHITGRFYLWGESAVSYGERKASFRVRSVHPDHRFIENTQVRSGRFLNDLDLSGRRKVTVIGREVARFLFRGADPLGRWVQIARRPFQVVGVFEDTGGVREEQQIYIPITTARAVFHGGRQIHQLMFTVGDLDAVGSARVEWEVRALLAQRHHFDPDDPQALRVRNNVEQFAQIRQVFAMLRAFVWVVGVGTVLAGVVGVSNIMLVSVQERTVEFGVRKALGATPAGIVGMVVSEAVLLTGAAGWLGLAGGIGLVELARWTLPANDYVRDPEVDLGAAVGAALLLVACGALAGFFPAWRAARTHPVHALRDA